MNHKYNRKLNESVKEAIRRVVLRENINLGSMDQPTVGDSSAINYNMPNSMPNNFSRTYFNSSQPSTNQPPNIFPQGKPPRLFPSNPKVGEYFFEGGMWYYRAPNGRIYFLWTGQWYDLQTGEWIG